MPLTYHETSVLSHPYEFQPLTAVMLAYTYGPDFYVPFPSRDSFFEIPGDPLEIDDLV